MPKFSDAEARSYVLARFPGTVFHIDYPGTKVGWEMTCPQGHRVAPRLGGIIAGQGICKYCGKRAAAEKMRLSQGEARAVVLAIDPGVIFLADYVNNKTPWPMLCGSGHECSPRLDAIKSGQGICATCGYEEVSRKLTRTQEEARLLVLARFPGTIFLEDYANGRTPWRMICPNGHSVSPILEAVVQGAGICPRCSGCWRRTDDEAMTLLDELDLGVTVLEAFPGFNKPWKMVCANGHLCRPRLASLVRGQGPCLTCGHEAGASRRRYSSHQANEILCRYFPGAVPLEPYPESVSLPWKLLCPVGHITKPRLGNIIMGQGMCRTCSPGGYDINRPGWLYLLHDRIGTISVNQYGISNALETRLTDHKRTGFINLPHRLYYSENGEAIANLERAVKVSIKARGLVRCHDIGVVFSGSTEALPESSISIHDLTVLVDSLLTPEIEPR